MTKQQQRRAAAVSVDLIVWTRMPVAAFYWWKLLQQERIDHGKEEIASWSRMKQLLISRFAPSKCSKKGQAEVHSSSNLEENNACENNACEMLDNLCRFAKVGRYEVINNTSEHSEENNEGVEMVEYLQDGESIPAKCLMTGIDLGLRGLCSCVYFLGAERGGGYEADVETCVEATFDSGRSA